MSDHETDQITARHGWTVGDKVQIADASEARGTIMPTSDKVPGHEVNVMVDVENAVASRG